MTAIDKTFEATLVRSPAKGGWTYIVTDWSADFFGTRGLVKVVGTIDGHELRTSLMPLGDGRHKLPVKSELRSKLAREAGDSVTVHLTERIDT